MIPLTLTIEGLYSYQGKQSIDFKALTEAQLFGIFGATGSGKSSILEAISYALYGESERLNNKDDRKYNMMNLRSNRMFISFEFEIHQKRYQFNVEAKRRKKFLEIAPPKRSAYEWSDDSWAPIDLTVHSASDILGLSYQNFKRTIIIPQGKFQEFLQLTDTERTRMLRQIFHLDKYELYPKVTRLQARNREQVARIETRLENLTEINQETISEAANQVKLLEAEQEKLNKQRSQKEKSLTQLEEQRRLFQRLAEQQSKLEQLNAQKEDFASRNQRLQAYEECQLKFQPVLKERKDIRERLEKTERDKRIRKENITKVQEELQKAENSFQQIRLAYQDRNKLLQEAEETDQARELKELLQRYDDKAKRIEKGNALILQVKAQINTYRDLSAELNLQQDQLREDRPDVNLLIELSNWFNEKNKLDEAIRKLQDEQNELDQQYLLWEEEKLSALEQTSLESVQYSLPLIKLFPILRDMRSWLEEKLAKQEEIRQQIAVKLQLHSLSESLEEGSPCPLCGAIHHPNPATAGQWDQPLREMESEITTSKGELSDINQALLKLESLERESTTLEARKNNIELRSAGQRQNVFEHDEAFIWADFNKNEADKIKQLQERLRETERQLEELQKRLQDSDRGRIEEEQKLEKYQNHLSTLVQEQNDLEIKIGALKQGIKIINLEVYLQKQDSELLSLSRQLKERYNELEQLYDSTEQRIIQLRSRQDSLRTETEMLSKQSQELTQDLAQVRKRLQEMLDKSEFSSLEQVEQMLDLALDTRAERNAINAFHLELSDAEGRLRELQLQLQSQTFNEEFYQKLKEEVNAIQDQLSELGQQLGAAKNELEKLEQAYAQKQILQKEEESLKLRATDLDTLNKLFARSGFVNYVSTIYLQNLCQAANYRFMKLTRNTLSLETTKDNRFVVRDYLNNGQLRNVKTLSGGQTFQAALSLALALADQVQQQARSPQNFFFLDEGFGSQDKNSLQIIFQTLTALRKENRIVGVISHVEELQEQIDTYLFIENDPETGSQIKNSWEI